MSESGDDIKFLNRDEIDIVKWDNCIIQAGNGLIYARSFYLDKMAENWSALVKGDYGEVMPLPWNRKFGFNYLYQPYFTKTLGVFRKENTLFEISSFLRAIPDKYKYWDIDLNENNFVTGENENDKLSQYSRTNHFLPLDNAYNIISQQYKRLAKRMLRKATSCQLQITRAVKPEVIIQSYRKNYAKKNTSITESIYIRLIECTQAAFENNLAETYLALSPTDEILAYYIILKDQNFIYSLIGGSNEEGKHSGAFYLLTDEIIKDHAGSGKIFRFEGSDIPGISFFDALFGSHPVTYPHVLMNRLPFPFNLFK